MITKPPRFKTINKKFKKMETNLIANLVKNTFEFPTGERIPRQTTAVVATNFSILLPARLLNIHKSKISFEFQGLHKRVEKEKNKGEQGRKKCKFLCSAKIH